MSRRELMGAAGVIVGAGLAPAVAGATTTPGSGAPTEPKSDQSNRFDFSSIEPQVVREFGTITEAIGSNFPVLLGNAGAAYLFVLKPGGLREPHWHPNAWELDVPLSGHGRLGVVNPTDTTAQTTYSVQDILPGQIGFIPQGYAHYIQNIGSEDVVWVLVFNNTFPSDIGLSSQFGGMPTFTFTDTFGLPESALADAVKPENTLFFVEELARKSQD